MLELCICMPEKTESITFIIIVASSIFLLAAGFLFAYVIIYSNKKRRHKQEKLQLQKTFETELIKTEVEVQEQTRRHLSSELHDNIGQILSLTNVTLASIDLENREKAVKKISTAHELVNRSIKELRQLSKLIHGEKLIQHGLKNAIETEMSWLERSGFYTINFSVEPIDFDSYDPDKDLILFRLFQEVINNIVKHSEATDIFIYLSIQNEQIILSVKDNGKGFNVETASDKKSGLGLQNMKRRIMLLEGTMQIISRPDGTQVQFVVPYKP